MPLFKCHSPKQERIIFSDKRIVIGATGIQFGKTSSLALWMKMQMHTHTRRDDNFLLVSPTYPIFKQSTLPPFLRYMDGLGRYNRKEECFEMYNGGTCWFRTGKNPDSIVGLTNIKAIGADEAGLFSLYFWTNILGRSSFCKAPIRIVTSPYSLNWLYQDYIRPIRKDPSSRPDVEIIQAASCENPYFPMEEYLEKQRTMDPRRFNMMYGGQFDKMQGLVYDCFDEDLNVIAPFEMPRDAVLYGGIDWGYTEPFALAVHAILPNGDRYLVDEVKRSYLTLPDIEGICKQKRDQWGIKLFYAGPDQPASIEYLNRQGVTTVAANNDIRLGVDTMYEQFKLRTFKVFSTCRHTLDELSMYHYPDPKDLKPDQSTKDTKPVGQNDHCLDSDRYCCVMTTQSHRRLTPKAPTMKAAKTEEQKIKALLKTRR